MERAMAGEEMQNLSPRSSRVCHQGAHLPRGVVFGVTWPPWFDDPSLLPLSSRLCKAETRAQPAGVGSRPLHPQERLDLQKNRAWENPQINKHLVKNCSVLLHRQR